MVDTSLYSEQSVFDKRNADLQRRKQNQYQIKFRYECDCDHHHHHHHHGEDGSRP